jgi:hypothetical protein
LAKNDMTWNRIERRGLMAAAALACILQGACTAGVYTQNFQRDLAVNGPVRLEVETGAGKISITRGAAGRVSIRGEVRRRGIFTMSAEKGVREIAANPPIEQVGNVIRLGKDQPGGGRGLTIGYIIEAPEETRVEAASGSGEITVKDIHGPAKLRSGSGRIEVENIGDDVSATTGSGGCHISRVAGRVTFTAGSGGAMLEDIREEIRGSAKSGMVQIERPGSRVAVETKSGGITVRDAKGDVRASAGSGTLDISGSPAPHTYWELASGSGGIDISVPNSASFRLHAKTASGRVSTALPIAIAERTGKELRADVGSGEARVEANSSSGSILIR